MLWFEEALLFYLRIIYYIVIIWYRKIVEETSQECPVTRSLFGSRSHPQGLVSRSQMSQVFFLSHVRLGEAQSCFHCPVNPTFCLFPPVRAPGKPGECWWTFSEKREQQLDWHWNRFGFSLIPPNPDLSVAAVQAPPQESWFAAWKSPIISIFF